MVFFTFMPKVDPAAYGHSRLSAVHINAVYALDFRCPGLQGPWGPGILKLCSDPRDHGLWVFV